MPPRRTNKRSFSFDFPVTVTVTRLKVRRARSVAFLDIDKLGRAAKAEFDFGHITFEGRVRTVRAVVRRGRVVGVRCDLCRDCKPGRLPAEAERLRDAMQQRIGPTGGRPARPPTVEEFLRQQVPERSECRIGCHMFFCLICCGFPSDPDSWVCSWPGKQAVA